MFKFEILLISIFCPIDEDNMSGPVSNFFVTIQGDTFILSLELDAPVFSSGSF